MRITDCDTVLINGDDEECSFCKNLGMIDKFQEDVLNYVRK
jgi:hypothetical protein